MKSHNRNAIIRRYEENRNFSKTDAGDYESVFGNDTEKKQHVLYPLV